MKDYKPKPISQDSENNNEWYLLQTASGAIVVILYAIYWSLVNIYRGL